MPMDHRKGLHPVTPTITFIIIEIEFSHQTQPASPVARFWSYFVFDIWHSIGQKMSFFMDLAIGHSTLTLCDEILFRASSKWLTFELFLIKPAHFYYTCVILKCHLNRTNPKRIYRNAAQSNGTTFLNRGNNSGRSLSSGVSSVDFVLVWISSQVWVITTFLSCVSKV